MKGSRRDFAQRRLFLACSTLAGLHLLSPARAEDLSFVAPGSSVAWFSAANWDPGRVPTAADAATIDNGATVYIISGGTATAQSLILGPTSLSQLKVNPTGAATFANVSVGGLSTLQLDGGTLNLVAGGQFTLNGALDFRYTGSAVTVGDGGVLNWAGGQLKGTDYASVTAGPNTTIYLPANFNPYVRFRSFSTQGNVINVAGETIVIPAGFTVTATTDRPDPTRVEGTLRSTSGFSFTQGGVELVDGGLITSTKAATVNTDCFVRGGAWNSSSIAVSGGNGTGFTLSQGGGTVAVNALAIAESSGGRGRYVMTGGTLTVGDHVYVGEDFGSAAGTFVQRGGAQTAGAIYVRGGCAYEFSGGTLSVANEFRLTNATLDFAGGDGTLRAGTLTEWSAGTILNARNTTFIGAGPGSLAFFPAGFDPRTAFKSFSTEGLWHTEGTPLVIPAGKTIAMGKGRPDTFVVEGTLQTTSATGFTFGLGGVDVATGGRVDMAGKNVYVEGDSVVRGGTLTAQWLDAHSGATLRQTGGTVAASFLKVAGNAASQRGAYRLEGGAVTTAETRVGYATSYNRNGIGQFYQSGGTHTAGKVALAPGSLYELSGGTLSISGRFDSSGTVDFAGGTGTLVASGGAVIDWSPGTVRNAGNATFTGGARTQAYFPAGFDPRTAFKSFSTQGLWHTAGTPLVIPTGFDLVITGYPSADRPDPMIVHGMLRTADSYGMALTQGGVTVADGGWFAMEGKRLTVAADSGVTGGLLRTRVLEVTGTTVATRTFRQTGGTVTVTEATWVTAGASARYGVYELAGGTFTTPALNLGFYQNTPYSLTGYGKLDQTGGALVADTVTLDARSSFSLRGGTLRVGKSFTGAGTVDVAGNFGLIAADRAIVDWDNATVGDVTAATVTAGVDSEVYLPAGADPQRFGAFASQGLVHVRGTPLGIPAGVTRTMSLDRAAAIDVDGTLNVKTAVAAAAVQVKPGGRLDATGFTVGATGASRVEAGGTVLATGLTVLATGAPAEFVHAGGAVTLTGPLAVNADAAYLLDGGTLAAAALTVAPPAAGQNAGTFRQTGGAATFATVSADAGARIELTGGTLRADTRFTLAGTLDFAGGDAAFVAGDNAVIDWSKATLLNAANATYAGGVNSESYFPAGFDPLVSFKGFTSGGLWHVAGQPLIVPAGFTVTIAGDRPDLIRVQGTLRGTGGPLGLTLSAGGVRVEAGGLFDMAGKVLTMSTPSSITGGRLTAGTLSLYHNTGSDTPCRRPRCSPIRPARSPTRATRPTWPGWAASRTSPPASTRARRSKASPPRASGTPPAPPWSCPPGSSSPSRRGAWT